MLCIAVVLKKHCVRHSSSLCSNVRVRFAPSPTGFLHLGGLRTALYNYLYAKKNGGKFILRIEDTDQKRVKIGAVENFNSMLKWTGLLPDESPEIGGPFSPYIQSQRLEIYKEKADILLEKGFAYRCFCSETRLSLLRKEAEVNRLNQGYDNKCRHLTKKEENSLLDDNKPFTIRFKIPEGPVTHKDIVFGENTYYLSENEGDFIILKSDGFPTYHFSCVVDDHLMDISHVLRGTEWLISTPKHILLHRAFGWRSPHYAHLPLLVNSDRSKLSKRQDAASVQYFKKQGYFPESLLNFLASAGGGFGRQEGCFVYDLPTLSKKFELENVNTNSCIVDFKKLDIFNRNYIVKQLSHESTAVHLVEELRSILREKYGESYEKEEKNLPDSYVLKILAVYKDRLSKLCEFVDKDLEYLWTAPDFSIILKNLEELKVNDGLLNGWKRVIFLLSSIPDEQFTQNNLAVKVREMSDAEKIPYGPLMRSLRIVLTGQRDGPGIAEMLEMLGKERSVSKISAVLDELDKKKVFNNL